MKNKLIGFLVVFIISSAAFPLVGSDTHVSTMYHDRASMVLSDCGCENSYDSSLFISGIGPSIEEKKTNPENRPTARSDLPDMFSWKQYIEKDWTTPSRDQGNCGSCWLCAGLGALESIIQIRENCSKLRLDLSEQYVLSCLPQAGSCKGGWAYRAFRYIKSNTSTGNNCNGIIYERCFSYQANDSVDCSEACAEWESFLIPLNSYGYWAPSGSSMDRDAIKTQIIEQGPVVAAMYATYYTHGPGNFEEWGWTHHDADDYYPYHEALGTNHQVVIIGWKDDPAIANGGYWICKNSFSEEWGYHGFFNIEYGSLNIDGSVIDWVDYNAQNYSNWLPVAETNGPYQANSDEPISFDAQKSFDHEGKLVTHVWDLGDGTQQSGLTITHSYAEQGVYPITLTVEDADGYTDAETSWAFIGRDNRPPNTPRLRGRRNADKTQTYRCMFRAVDPEGDDVYYYLNWGDTYWTGWWEGWIGPYKSGEWVTLENTWEAIGNYTIRVKAKDRYGAKSEFATLPVCVPHTLFRGIRLLDQLTDRILYLTYLH